MLFVGKRKSNMAKYKVIPGGVCAAKGFSASGVHAGFRANPYKLDLAIIKADVRRKQKNPWQRTRRRE